MGLNIVVGLGDIDDEEGAEWFTEEVALANEVLRAAGQSGWTEPTDVVETDFEMGGYSALHTLRRLAAHLATSGELPPPLDDSTEVGDDDVLASLYREGPGHYAVVRKRFGFLRSSKRGSPGQRSFEHLIHHPDAEGLYVPVDFEPVVVSNLLIGGYIGSSHRLLAECLLLAEALQLDPDLAPDSDEVVNAMEADVRGSVGWQRYGTEAFVCLNLIGAARLSVATNAAICFC
jgi:hypothetical protein